MPTTASRFFLYTHCNDLAGMRDFYSRLLGLEELFFAEGADGGLAYRLGGVQFTVLPAPEELPADAGWDRQPGWNGGTGAGTSWSIEVGDLEPFRDLVERLVAAEVPRFDECPQWRGYWSLPVKDPMGNTVEVTYAPADEPADKRWRSGGGA